MQRLVGTQVPDVRLTGVDGADVDPFGASSWTVLYCFPGAFAPGTHGYPRNWGDIPGAGGCTLESLTYRDRAAAFAAAGAVVRGVSTQRPDQLEDFSASVDLPFPLLSDQDSRLTAALRLPAFRASGQLRLKRLTLLVDPERRIRAVQFPILDPAGSVDEALDLLGDLAGEGPQEGAVHR